jgi:YihY family inner membrane protein
VVGPEALFATLDRALAFVVPGEGRAIVAELRAFHEHREKIGWILLFTMLFFSSLGFRVLENAIFVIFLHRVNMRKRPLAVSLLLPFGYIVFIGAGLMVGAVLIADLDAIARLHVTLFGYVWSLKGVSHTLIYLAGVLGEILLISGIYYFMPVGRLSVAHALIGGATAGVLWELVRLAMGWYIVTLSQVNVVYGSLTTAIIVLLSLELAATLLLLGAQIIAIYERIEPGGAPKKVASPHFGAAETAPAQHERRRRKADRRTHRSAR